MILLLVAPAAGAGVRRDAVIGEPSAAAARISADTTTARYPIDDGSGATIAIGASPSCLAACNAVYPQQIAKFVGTLIHGAEVELLTVQLETPYEIGFDCGYGAQACYYPSENRIVLSGNDTLAPDGANREFVLAHEYGHHVANHRQSPPPFPAAIDWGTARWSSEENICRGFRAGTLFPGDEGSHYFQDPGEAFAESFARNRFPDSGLRWRWLPILKPGPAALEAIRRDTLEPWLGRESFLLAGRAPSPRRGSVVKSFRTPIDGVVSLRPKRLRHRYRLSLLNRVGRVLRTSRHGLSFGHQLNFTVCGQSRLTIRIRSTRRTGEGFKLRVQRP